MLDACLFMEETSRGMAPIGGYSTTLIVAGAVGRFGNKEQKDEILGNIAKGSVESIAGTSLVRFDAEGLVVEQRDVWAIEPGRRDLVDWAS